MKDINRLTIELINIEEEINNLYAKKKELTSAIKERYNQILNICRTTVKTIDDMEEM